MTTTLNESLTSRPPRDRSRVVCKRCHARKVKCDLSKRLYGSAICTNCEKRAEHCQRRDTTRARLSNQPSPSAGISDPGAAGLSATLTSTAHTLTPNSSLPSINIDDTQPQHYPAVPRSVDRGYVGEYSFLSNHGPLSFDAATSLGPVTRSIEAKILATSGVDQLPSKSNIDASAAAYFEYLYHVIPVLDKEDVTPPTPSTLILQSICFIGSLLRHPKSVKSLLQTEELYTRAKFLFFLNHEHEPLSILKALCLFTLWNVRPPSAVTMDCSWNWLGMASRVAVQMGLHRESTYLHTSTPKCARRIAWFIYCQDKMQAACFDRPPMLKTEDFDLHPLSVDDFDELDHEYALLFILIVDLAKIFSRLLEMRHANATTGSDEPLSVLESMREWVQNIPAEFRTSDRQGNIIYHRGFYGVLACYLTLVITFFHICRKNFQQLSALRLSLVASSCMIGLYQEMDYRDHINYLTVLHNWFMAAAVLAQLNHLSFETHGLNATEEALIDNSGTSTKELDTILEMLRQRTIKYPGGNAIVCRAEQLKHEILSAQDRSSLISHSLGVMYPGLPAPSTYATISRAHEFFPFPNAMSPRLALLDEMEAEDRGFTDTVFDEYPAWAMENLLGFNFPEFS